MKLINLFYFFKKIPSKKLNLTKKSRQPMLFSKRLKNTRESELKNNKMLEDGKKAWKTGKKQGNPCQLCKLCLIS